ncbi:protein SMAX1-LIKE 6-like [Impatiens glandulifera]|uniref:protein SMAX1-LIKE 6-like n=1 Tax=Impatiens glandulifera TaxID=253017 RepID=UPI001FB134B3|nr:protein SMAX1-LIKE 6-like [Impatiens glandulifera]
MPTPVTTARQCLTTDAALALDEAVVVSRRRAHAQTTSLHAVYALLSIPSSGLREACGRARNGAYSSRIQFKALELCLNVSLDRLPSCPNRSDEPPVSNSLMAAIKRSQANQRRQPESFHLYNLRQETSSSVSTVRVELPNLILSILDDPVVSRVFGEAGFRSYDIKFAILRPVHHFSRCSRYRGPPVFLCNLTGDSNTNSRAFSFPFMGFSNYPNGENHFKRIGEIIIRNSARNPLLVGVSAINILRSFSETVEKSKGLGVLPVEMSGIIIISIENEVPKLISDRFDDDHDEILKLKFQKLGETIEKSTGPGVIINYGDLQVLVADHGHESNRSSSSSSIVREITRLLDVYRGKVWLIGAALSYQTYLKLLNRFPSIEKDWDLQLLPITSLAPAMEESYIPRSCLTEEPFVGLGGLLSCSYQFPTPFNNIDKHDQNVIPHGISCGDLSVLPSWSLESNESRKPADFDDTKADDDDDVIILNVKAAGVPTVVGFKVNDDRSGSGKNDSCVSIDLEESPSPSETSATTNLGLVQKKNRSFDRVPSFSSRFDRVDFKMLYRALSGGVVVREDESFEAISRAIARHGKSDEKRSRGDVWFGFLGPNRFGKKRVAIALAEILYASKENFISIDLSSEDCIFLDNNLKFRGKTVVDFIAHELNEKPSSLVFLENIDKADPPTKNSLIQAVKTGKFSDSHGREVSLNNAVFVAATSAFINIPNSFHGNGNYSEEKVLNAVKTGPVRIAIECRKTGTNKRKLSTETLLSPKRSHKINLDLNIAASEDTEEVEEAESMMKWLESFIELMDERIEFKGLELDSMAEKIRQDINDCFHKIFGLEIVVEIEERVMEGLLAAACSMSESSSWELEAWIKGVLAKGFEEAEKRQKNLQSWSSVRLVVVTGEDLWHTTEPVQEEGTTYLLRL